jgi:Tfp pilus assembly protein PilN
MRAVNLMPDSAGRGRRADAFQIPGYAVIAVLAAALVLVTVYVMTNNTIADRQAQVGSLQAQAAQANAQAASLSKYIKFEQLAQTRAETVRQIAATRFDWHSALSNLSKVVPANTSLQSLYATVAPGSGSGGGPGTGNTSALRSDVTVPAFELTGCTQTQDDVARLMSRLRLINGVTRVTLADSTKPNSSTGAGAAVGSGGSSTASGCGANAPTFDLVIFFSPLAGASPTGTATAATGATTPSTTTTTPSTTTTSSTTTTPSTGTTATPPAGASTTGTTSTGTTR